MLPVRKRHTRPLVIVTTILLVAIAVASWYGYTLYQRVMSPNTHPDLTGNYIIHLYPGTDYESLLDTLEVHRILHDKKGFEWAARQMDLPGQVKPGRYVLKPGMNNREIAGMFRGGYQAPVMLPIVKKRLLPELAEHVSARLMFTPEELLELLDDPAVLDSLGFTRETVIGMFLTDSYEMYWTIGARQFLHRMKREWDTYWNEDRLAKARRLNLTPIEVVILASIVEEETVKEDERNIVAGVYLNRLRIGMQLQADPTVKFAVGDFGLRRILYKHLEIESPYNTYKVAGLPPGPICLPFKSAIEAVLNPASHDYIFMCAKDDFSGYHNFARTPQQHAINRQKYIRAIEREGIR